MVIGQYALQKGNPFGAGGIGIIVVVQQPNDWHLITKAILHGIINVREIPDTISETNNGRRKFQYTTLCTIAKTIIELLNGLNNIILINLTRNKGITQTILHDAKFRVRETIPYPTIKMIDVTVPTAQTLLANLENNVGIV
jgi:hypothetical protein